MVLMKQMHELLCGYHHYHYHIRTWYAEEPIPKRKVEGKRLLLNDEALWLGFRLIGDALSVPLAKRVARDRRQRRETILVLISTLCPKLSSRMLSIYRRMSWIICFIFLGEYDTYRRIFFLLFFFKEIFGLLLSSLKYMFLVSIK